MTSDTPAHIKVCALLTSGQRIRQITPIKRPPGAAGTAWLLTFPTPLSKEQKTDILRTLQTDFGQTAQGFPCVSGLYGSDLERSGSTLPIVVLEK